MKRILITAALIAATSSAASAGTIRHNLNVCLAQVSEKYMACGQHNAIEGCLVTWSDGIDICQDKAEADRKAYPDMWRGDAITNATLDYLNAIASFHSGNAHAKLVLEHGRAFVLLGIAALAQA